LADSKETAFEEISKYDISKMLVITEDLRKKPDILFDKVEQIRQKLLKQAKEKSDFILATEENEDSKEEDQFGSLGAGSLGS
jgi:hypothetical protein